MGQQRQIGHALARRPKLSGLPQPARRHLQHAALIDNRPHILVLFDEGVSNRDSLAKYAAAFFRMSRSIRVRASSAFNRLISICSALTALTPARSVKRPAASAFTQLCGVWPDILSEALISDCR